MTSKVSTRYATAILGSLKGSGSSEKGSAVVEELRRFAAALASSKELELVLGTDLFANEEKVAIVKDICDKLSISPEGKKILFVIAEMKRMPELPEIAAKLNDLILMGSGVVPLRVQSANDLNKEERKALETRFSKVLGKTVAANYEITSSLVGGVRVTAGGRTYDGSVAGWLGSIEEQMVRGSL